jgi:hypothetical protein
MVFDMPLDTDSDMTVVTYLDIRFQILVLKKIYLFTTLLQPGLAPTTHLPTHPLGFLGGWAVEKTQKNPLLCKNH